MINIQCNFRAKSLYMPITINVLLPSFFEHAATEESLDEVYKDKQFCYKTLYLLHGGVEDAHSWLAYTNIEKYADKHKLAVVLPSVGNSFYTDLVHGPAYWTFVSEELPRFCQSVFPLSDKREDNFVAGLSMGGYGAFKMALNHPDRFAAAISLSGALDIVGVLTQPDMIRNKLEDYFENLAAVQNTGNDLFYQLKKLKGSGTKIPRLYMACGVDDFIYAINQKYLKFLKEEKVPVTYEEGPGAHEWNFWDTYIERGINWLFQ
ncbi:MAG: esterase family protein [Pelolinea sp.]|jgi:putative tributyrin esterase|nr:esterase family protein [Pelolinea sp.]